MVPRLPHTPCTEEAPTGSSIFRRCSINSTAKIMTVPQMAPIRAAPIGDTRSHPAVTPTSPARIPLSVRESDGLPYLIQLTIKARNPPVQAARLVVRNTCEMAVWSPYPAAASCEPGLKPNHPNQRMNTPRQASVRLWPGMAFDFPSFPYLPKRGPRMAAPTNAIHPPTE